MGPLLEVEWICRDEIQVAHGSLVDLQNDVAANDGVDDLGKPDLEAGKALDGAGGIVVRPAAKFLIR